MMIFRSRDISKKDTILIFYFCHGEMCNGGVNGGSTWHVE